MNKKNNQKLSEINDCVVMRQGALVSFNVANNIIQDLAVQAAKEENLSPGKFLEKYWPGIFQSDETEAVSNLKESMCIQEKI